MSDLTPTTAPPDVTPAAPPTRMDRVRAWREAHPHREALTFFALGFLYDVATLDRIDKLWPMLQQAIWLVLLGTLLVLTERYGPGRLVPGPKLEKLMSVSEGIIHFLFGGLLSSFALFYFKSAAGLTSMIFASMMFVLLISNELPHFRKLGPVVRFGLYSFCLTSYFSYILPIVFGFLSVFLFLGAILLSFCVTYGLFRIVTKVRDDRNRAVVTTLLPAAFVQAALVGLYLLQVVPPVPLSVQYMGIYHDVERHGREFWLTHEKPPWRFWHHGDQDFRARAGDKVYVFATVFAPRRFKDRVNIRWMIHDEKRGWLTSDVIPLTIDGKREEGYRGYAYKANWKPGEWRVQVETEDGRAIGHIGFELTVDEGDGVREFEADIM